MAEVGRISANPTQLSRTASTKVEGASAPWITQHHSAGVVVAGVVAVGSRTLVAHIGMVRDRLVGRKKTARMGV